MYFPPWYLLLKTQVRIKAFVVILIYCFFLSPAYDPDIYVNTKDVSIPKMHLEDGEDRREEALW